jgi:hypothetical protein
MNLLKTIKNINIKNLTNDDNKTKLIGLLTILIVLWLVLYFIPEIFASLFNTLLGNLILLLVSILVLTYDIYYGIIFSIILIVIYRFSLLTKTKSKKEGFVWNKNSENNFLSIQNTINVDKIFDVNLIQETQASQQELNYFNENGIWPWSDQTIELYKEAINKNPIVRTYYKDAINYARTIYNEAAILRILSYQTKEGGFLLNGVLIKDPSGNKFEDLPSGYGDFAYRSGLLENRSDDIIKCNMKNSNGATLERIKYTGKGGIFGEQTSITSPVDYNNLEKIIPGFTFVNGPCNPCGAINENPDYSCPFNLKLKNDRTISNVWNKLWGL